MVELVVGFTLLAASGLAFVAYNHPRQFNWFANVHLAVFITLIAVALVAQRAEQLAVKRVQTAPMLEEQRTIAIQAISARATLTPLEDLIASILFYSYFYVGTLTFLPAFGLTADEKTKERRTSEEMPEPRRRLRG